MYSRNFFKEDVENPTPPENYGGTALSEDESTQNDECFASAEAECGCHFFDGQKHPSEHSRSCKNEERGCHPCEENRQNRGKRCPPEGRLFGGLFGGGLFSGTGIASLFEGGGIKSLLSNIGTEEILLIATALFLFLSKDGDKECAIMLLLLLVV